jgi:hypothetical protein
MTHSPMANRKSQGRAPAGRGGAQRAPRELDHLAAAIALLLAKTTG